MRSMRNQGEQDERTPTEWLKRVRNPDDSEAWEWFYQRYQPLILRYALKRKLNFSDAEDLVQETLIELIKRLRDFEYDGARGKFRCWVLNLTQWRIINFFQRKQGTTGRERDLSLDDNHATARWGEALAADTAAEAWERDWQRALFTAALRELTPKGVQVIDLLMVKELSVEDTARLLGMTHTHVYATKSRALAALRAAIRRLDGPGF